MPKPSARKFSVMIRTAETHSIGEELISHPFIPEAKREAYRKLKEKTMELEANRTLTDKNFSAHRDTYIFRIDPLHDSSIDPSGKIITLGPDFFLALLPSDSIWLEPSEGKYQLPILHKFAKDMAQRFFDTVFLSSGYRERAEEFPVFGFGAAQDTKYDELGVRMLDSLLRYLGCKKEIEMPKPGLDLLAEGGTSLKGQGAGKNPFVIVSSVFKRDKFRDALKWLENPQRYGKENVLHFPVTEAHIDTEAGIINFKEPRRIDGNEYNGILYILKNHIGKPGMTEFMEEVRKRGYMVREYEPAEPKQILGINFKHSPEHDVIYTSSFPKSERKFLEKKAGQRFFHQK